MVGIAILIVELIFPMVLLATWALLTYFLSLGPSNTAVSPDKAPVIMVFGSALAISIAVSPLAVGLLMIGYGGWMLALFAGAIVNHTIFLLAFGQKEAAYDLGLTVITSLPGMIFAGALWYCAQLCRPEKDD
ncbi:hypothetical protein [Yoonia tamlensis]|nr:hypothetical protein [Yoonia tamlensis]